MSINDILVWLLVAGLVAGIAFFTIDFSEFGTVSQDTDIQKQESISETDQESPDQGVEEEKETYTTRESSGDVETLHLRADYVKDDAEVTSRYRVRNPGTKRRDIRIDSTKKDGSTMIIILREEEKEAWIQDYNSNEWTHITGFAFSQLWLRRGDEYLGFKEGTWKAMEGERSKVETEDGATVTVYDVRVNSRIPDSVFSP